MNRREFLAATAVVATAVVPISLLPETRAPLRQWKLFDVAWIDHAGMCVCVRGGTDDTALWQKSEKWERALLSEITGFDPDPV